MLESAVTEPGAGGGVRKAKGEGGATHSQVPSCEISDYIYAGAIVFKTKWVMRRRRDRTTDRPESGERVKPAACDSLQYSTPCTHPRLSVHSCARSSNLKLWGRGSIAVSSSSHTIAVSHRSFEPHVSPTGDWQ